MKVKVRERNLAQGRAGQRCRKSAEHHHAGDPEEQDVVAGDQHGCGVKLRQFGGCVRPTHGGERPQRRGEPGVQNVRVLHIAFGGLFIGADTHDIAVGSVPDRDAVPPPELAGDGPVVHVVHPLEIAWVLARGVDGGVAVPHGVASHAGEFINLDKPLLREPGFYGLAGAFRMPHRVQVGAFFRDDAALLGQCLADFHPGFKAIHAIELGAGVGDAPTGVQDGGHVQVVAQTQRVVVGVVRGGDLHGTGTELGVHVVVGNNNKLPTRDEGVRQAGAHQVCVAGVVGVNGHRDVAKHGFHAGCGHHNVGFVVI